MRGFVRAGFSSGRNLSGDVADADKIMDLLDQRGFIALQWRNVKTMMDDARNLDRKGDDT